MTYNQNPSHHTPENLMPLKNTCKDKLPRKSMPPFEENSEGKVPSSLQSTNKPCILFGLDLKGYVDTHKYLVDLWRGASASHLQ
jgi:hypothetical protein